MFDQFLRNKINSLFDKFIEDKPGETNIRKWDGIIEMHDLRLKKTLVDLLCPLLGMPMTFIGGRVAKLTVQIPWSSLLKDETRVVVEGVSILCHTSDTLNPEYFKENRRRYIDRYIRTYFDHNNELQTRKNKYLARIQDFIFGRVSLEVRNVHLCLENSLERPFVAGLVCQQATIRNFYTNDQHKASLQLKGIGAYLNLLSTGFASTFPQRLEQFLQRANNVAGRRYVVKPTQITYERVHITSKQEVQNILTFEPIQVQINNVTADMLRLLLRLIEWHSCCNRTCVFRERFTRSNNKGSAWWRYLAQVILDQYRSSRGRRRYEHQALRRRYIQHYRQLYKGRHFINKLGPNNTFLKLSDYNDLTEKIKEMEDTLELFEIIEYRKYAEMLIKSKQEIEKSMETIRKKEYSWFTAYFASKEDSSSQKQLQQEAKELATLENIKVSIFAITVERLQIAVVVRIEQHEDPFMRMRVNRISFRRTREKNGQRRTLDIEDCSVTYADYLGYFKGYRNLLERMEVKFAEDDEFEDFKKSIVQVQWRIHPQQTHTDVRIEPFRIIMNDQTMDKLMLFKEAHSRSTNQPSFELNRNITYQEVKQDLGMNTPSKVQVSINLEMVVPESMYEPSTEIIVSLEGIQVNIATQSLQPPTFNVNVGVENISCRLRYVEKDTVLDLLLQKAQMLQYLFEKMNTRCEATITGNNQEKGLLGKIRISLSEVGMKCTNRELEEVLYLAKRFSRFFLQKNKQKPTHRRKPSLGEEFLDVVENLTDHVYKGSISHSNIKRSRSMFNLQDASSQVVALMDALNVDFSCPEVRMGYYLAGKLHNSVSLSTLSVLVNQLNANVQVQTFANKLEVVMCEYIYFGDSLKKVQAFVDSNKGRKEEQSVKVKKDKEVSNIQLALKACLYSACIKLYAKENLLFVASMELNLEGSNLSRSNRQLKSSMKFRLETSYLNRKNERKSLDVIQPFRVLVDFDQVDESISGKAVVEEVILNLTGELFSAISQLSSNVVGEIRTYRIVNHLNIPVHVKGRPSGFVEVPSGKEVTVKAAHNHVLQYVVQSVKYTETGEDHFEVFVSGSNIRLIRQLRPSKEGTTVTFRSNIKFLNESANSVGLTVLRKEIVQDEDDEDYFRGSRRVSVNLIKSKQEIYLMCQDIRQLDFEVKLDQDMNEELQPLNLAAFLKENTEKLLTVADTFLVLYPKVMIKPATSQSKELIDYNLHICCPLEVSNYLPGPISLRFLKEQPLEDHRPWTETSSNRYLTRSKSVEMLALEKVNPLDCYSLSSASLEDINEIYVEFGRYCKTFKLDLQYEMLEQQESWERRKDKNHQPSEQFEIVKVVTLTNAGIDQLNIVCRMAVRRHSIRLFFMSDVVIFNLLDFSLNLRIKEEGYFYSQMTAASAPARQLDNYMLSDRSYNHKETLRTLFEESRDNLILFTGDSQCANRLFFFNDNEVGYDDRFSQPIINIDRQEKTAVAVIRRVQLDFGLVLLFISPICTFINRSTSSVLVRSGDITEKTVRPHEKEPVTTFLGESVRIGIRSGMQPSKSEQFHIDSNILGIVYFRREVAPHQYRFFRVLTSKSEYQTNILLEDSEYPPITFINRLKQKIRITQMNLPRDREQPEDLNESQSLEYALIDPYQNPRFKVSIYNYECTTLKDDLQFDKAAQLFICYDKRTKKQIFITTETFKDQRIVLVGYSREQGEQIQKAFRSGRQPLLRLTVSIKEFGVSLFTASYREYGYLQYESIEFDYKHKVRHSSLYFKIQDTNMYGYSDVEPRLMLSVDHETNLLQSIRNKVGLDSQSKSFVELRVKYNFAPNVRVIKYMQIQLLPVLVHLDVKFLIDMLQNCMPLVPTLKKIGQTIGGKLIVSNNSELAVSKSAETFYIVEHVKIGHTNLELSFDNLETLKQIYEGSTVYSLIISFLNNMGKLKPITVEELEFRYENVTLAALLKLFNMRNHVKEIVGQIMLRPAKQIHAAAMTLMGFTSVSEDSSLISSSLATSWYVVKTLLKNLVRGRQLDMSELQVDNSDVITKLCSLKYWKVQKQGKKYYDRTGRYDNQSLVEYDGGFPRHERYTFGEVRPYDRNLSIAKVPIPRTQYILSRKDNHKTVFRINSLHRLSTKHLLFLTDNTAVFVDETECKAQFWSPQQILSIERFDNDLRIRLLLDSRPNSFKSIEFKTVLVKRANIEPSELDALKQVLKDFREEDGFYLC